MGAILHLIQTVIRDVRMGLTECKKKERKEMLSADSFPEWSSQLTEEAHARSRDLCLDWRADNSSHSPSLLESSYFKPEPGVRLGQHHSKGFGPRRDSTLRLIPRF